MSSNQSDAEEGYVDNTALSAPLLFEGNKYILHTTINNISGGNLNMLAKMDFNNDLALTGLPAERIARHNNFQGDTLLIDTFFIPTGLICYTVDTRFRLSVSTDGGLGAKAFTCASTQLDGDIEDYTVMISGDTYIYCTPIASNNIPGDSIGIFNVTLNTINNTSLTDQGLKILQV